jgi:hypothetical protein
MSNTPTTVQMIPLRPTIASFEVRVARVITT